MSLSKEADIIPNLYIIGFQKCGSSSLFEVLNSHPSIVGSDPKETFALVDPTFEHFNRDEHISNTDFSWSPYFKNAEGAKYLMEGSVCNFYQETAMDYIANIQDVKVIIAIRNPLDRFASCFNYSGQGGIHLPLETDLDSFFNLVQNSYIEKDLLRNALDHGEYSKFIDLWYGLVERKNIWLTSFERLKHDFKNEMFNILGFLGLNHDLPVNQLPKKNLTRHIKNEKLHYYLRQIFKGWGLRESVAGELYRRFNRTEQHVSLEMSPELKLKLENYYQQELIDYKDYFK